MSGRGRPSRARRRGSAERGGSSPRGSVTGRSRGHAPFRVKRQRQCRHSCRPRPDRTDEARAERRALAGLRSVRAQRPHSRPSVYWTPLSAFKTARHGWQRLTNVKKRRWSLHSGQKTRAGRRGRAVRVSVVEAASSYARPLSGQPGGPRSHALVRGLTCRSSFRS